MQKRTLTLAIALVAGISGCSMLPMSEKAGTPEQQVVANYADIAHATFEDAYLTAVDLQLLSVKI